MILFQTVAVIATGIIFFFGLSALIAVCLLGKYIECDCGRMNKEVEGWAYCQECKKMKQK
jgi:hypothetical protein